MSASPGADVAARRPDEPGRVRAESTPDGHLDLKVRTASGEWIRWQSLRSPEREAQGVVERALGGGPVPALVAVVGAGLGYIVDELQRRRPDVRVVALEVVPELVPLWQERSDLSESLASAHLVIGGAPDFAVPTVSWPPAVIADEPLVIVPPTVAHHWPQDVERARRVFAQLVFERRANEEARQRLAPMYLEHTLRNVPALVEASDVTVLDAVAAGEPVVLCGAGPSLDRLLPELVRNRERAWYVALDTSVRPLLAAGIVPDLVVSIDPTPLNGRHLLNLPSRRRPWLVAEGSVDPRAVTAFRGRIISMRVNRADPWPWLEHHGMSPTLVRAWGSVLTAACDVIARMRPASVAFAGIDLAYTNGQPYCRGTTFEEDWEAQRVRDALPSIEAVWAARLEGTTVEEIDVHGRAIQTTSHMVAFRNWARAEVARTPGCQFANVTGNGILHGAAIAQTRLSPWLDRLGAQAFAREARLQALHADGRRGGGNIVEAMRTAIAEPGEPWTGWSERVPRVDRPVLTRHLEHATRQIRAFRI